MRQGKELSQEDLESVVDKLSSMLSTRSDYDKDSLAFINEQQRLELDDAPPSWLPTRLQHRVNSSPATPAKLQGSQITAFNRDDPEFADSMNKTGPTVDADIASPSPDAAHIHREILANVLASADPANLPTEQV